MRILWISHPEAAALRLLVQRIVMYGEVKEAVLPDRLDRERIHLNKVAIRLFPRDLMMPRRNILRYDHPSPDTRFPLEYAFHLLGDLAGKTIVDFGCGDGLNTVILAGLGAKVIAVDISETSLETTANRIQANRLERNVLLVHGDAAGIPVADGAVDAVLCAATLQHVDCLAAARQIRRILKPGGIASFIEKVTGSSWLARQRGLPLTITQTHAVSRAVGTPGRSRKFRRLLASRLVWEARKES
jgi:SAM-dependent methyltransferase